MKTYDVILEGCEATEQQAREFAMGLDWSEVTISNGTIKYKTYIDTINGVDIWYDFGADYYFFSEEDL